MKKKQRLGELLREAHLISTFQIEEALKEQSKQPELRIGEILAKRGWLKPETADFFAEKWPIIVSQIDESSQQPLGYYLQEAALLDQSQMEELLAEQEEKEEQGQLWVRLGALAVFKGWLNQSTVDFLVENLYPKYAKDSPFIKPNSSDPQ